VIGEKNETTRRRLDVNWKTFPTALKINQPLKKLILAEKGTSSQL